MKKVMIAILLGCLIFSSGVVASNLYREYTVKETDYIIDIDNEVQTFELPIVSLEDHTYVALRELCEKMGYSVVWIENERRINLMSDKNTRPPFYGDMNKSEEGTLSNGMKYKFSASNDFSYNQFLTQHSFVSTPSNYGEVPTAKMAAEIGQNILGLNNIISADVNIQVYYDKVMDAWIVIGLSPISHGGMRTVVIQRSDGKIIEKCEIR